MSKFKDLTGQTFGRLTVISRASNSKVGQCRWNCVCSCGNKVVVQSSSLITGNTKSCGCLSQENRKAKLKNIAGQTFNRLTVVSRALNSKIGKTRWNCVCSCGNETMVHSSDLLLGNTTSCGCIRRETAHKTHLKDLTGQTFGRLTVLSRSSNSKKYKATRWNCICSCGNEKIVRSSHLLNGHTASCGCLQIEQLIARKLKRGDGTSKSATAFLNKIEHLFNIQIEREFELSHRYFDGRYKNHLIEIDSDYWHSSKKAHAIDTLKTQLAKDAGFKLIRVKVNDIKKVTPVIQQYMPVLTTILE